MEKKRKVDMSLKLKFVDFGVKKVCMDDVLKKLVKFLKYVEEEEDDFESFLDLEDGGVFLERLYKFDVNKNGDNVNSKVFE